MFPGLVTSKVLKVLCGTYKDVVVLRLYANMEPADACGTQGRPADAEPIRRHTCSVRTRAASRARMHAMRACSSQPQVVLECFTMVTDSHGGKTLDEGGAFL